MSRVMLSHVMCRKMKQCTASSVKLALEYLFLFYASLRKKETHAFAPPTELHKNEAESRSRRPTK